VGFCELSTGAIDREAGFDHVRKER
jgi:hypothetical protein